jgi:hypothetical protein
MEKTCFFARSSFAQDMEYWNIRVMEIKLPAQHSSIPSFHHSNFVSSISALFPAVSRNFPPRLRKF